MKNDIETRKVIVFLRVFKDNISEWLEPLQDTEIEIKNNFSCFFGVKEENGK